MISEQLRNRALARIALKRPSKADTADADLDNASAEVIDALVAALEKAAASAGFQYMMHETRDQIDAALAMARRK